MGDVQRPVWIGGNTGRAVLSADFSDFSVAADIANPFLVKVMFFVHGLVPPFRLMLCLLNSNCRFRRRHIDNHKQP